MTLRELIDDINLRMPNAFDESDLVKFINIALAEGYRHITDYEVYAFEAARGVSVYPLPTFIKFDMIENVWAGKKEYLPKNYSDEVLGNVYYAVPGNFIGLSPVPNEGEIFIRYKEKPTPFNVISDEDRNTPSLLTEYYEQTLNVSDEYAELIKYGVFIIIAEAKEDVNLANNYKQNYNSVIVSARHRRWKESGKYPAIKNVHRYSRGTSRYKLKKGRR